VAPEISPEVIVGYLRSDLPQGPSFQTFSEAREALLELNLAQFEVLKMEEAEYAAYTDRLHQWSRMFKALIESRERNQVPTTSERKTIALLELHRQNITINLSDFSPGRYVRDVMIWDKFTKEFGEMVENAALAVGLEADNSSSGTPLFHMDFGVISVLVSIAGKCRDPIIRRKAIGLMRAAPIQEGIWSSVLSARVTRGVVDLEESGRTVMSCKDIPMEARLQQLRVYIGPGGKRANIRYTFGYGNRYEVFEWN
jgi:hypothetical protein